MLPTIPSLRKPEYQISNSLRFRSSASAYLSRTFAVAGNRKTWTWSGWVKRGTLGTHNNLFAQGTGTAANGYGAIRFYNDTTDTLQVYASSNGTTSTLSWNSTALFRDTSAWYHVVVALDTTQATAADRLKVYVNGVSQAGTFSTTPSPSADIEINRNQAHQIGAANTSALTHFFDGYMAEVHFVDGQALTPVSFGVTSSKTGVWAPREYTGTYGTNGFYLDFVDNSAATSATIGKDRSGNYNSWTPTNISMVAGSTYDSMTDTPTQHGDAAYYYSGTQYPYNALNFRSSASTYLSRGVSVAGNRTTWTWSGWIKKNTLGGNQTLFTAGDGTSTNHTSLRVSNNTIGGSPDIIDLVTVEANVTKQRLITTQTYTDRSTWYHVVAVYDTNNAVAADRAILYVNGSRVTSFQTQTNPTSGQLGSVNFAYGGTGHRLGNNVYSAEYFDGYLADVNFIDGQALTPASFGETVNGTWIPKTYTGAYGTNGFYLKFNDNSAATAAALGRDSAGTNNWTPTNLATTDVTSTEITSRRLVNPSYGLQFRSSASAYLSRTPASAGNRTTWTWSSWIKLNNPSNTSRFYVGRTGTNFPAFGMAMSGGGIVIDQYTTGAALQFQIITSSIFRDSSVWYHLVVAFDTTQVTPANRIKVYVNGSQITAFSTASYPTQDFLTNVNTTTTQIIGADPANTTYFDGVLADINFIDGQALTPSSFGETDSTGTWVPKAYTGTYGTNGFYLNFADRSAMTAATIGNDASSNSNNWQPNNMVISDAIDYGVKSVRGNYAVLNPLAVTPVAATFAEANLKVTTANAGGNAFGTVAIPSSGKWYWEVTLGSMNNPYVGVASYQSTQTYAWNNTNSAFYSIANATKSVDGVFGTSYGTVGVVNDVIGVAVDADANTITFYKNNVSQGVISHTFVDIYPALTDGGSATSDIFTINFGQRPFAYTPPAGFKALCTHNLPDPAIVHGHAYMAATTYTGTGVGRNISNFSNNRSFRPDLVWIKSRSNATDHALYDTLRGAQQDLVSNSTAAETTQSTGLTAFNEDGFGLSTLTKLNSAGNTYVAWQWKAGDGVVTNTAGSITSQVDAGTTQGVSVVTYTGTGVNATVGHGLGVAPKMIIVKHRNSPTPNMSWNVYHASLGNTKALFLDTTGAEYTDSPSSLRWNNTSPTNTVFSIGTAVPMNQAGTSYVAYCFAEIAGYSKFGSYTGNGSADGPFVFCGLRPRWIMIKRTDATSGWWLFDTSRDTDNVVPIWLAAESAQVETNVYSDIDILSNGFKIRSNQALYLNVSNGTYIYAAFAEVPSKYALAR